MNLKLENRYKNNKQIATRFINWKRGIFKNVKMLHKMFCFYQLRSNLPFIHRSIPYLPLIRGRVEGATSSGEKPTHPSPQWHSPAPPVGSRGVPRPEGTYNPSNEFWVSRGAFSQYDVPKKTSKGRRPVSILSRCPNHLNWLFPMRRSGSHQDPPGLWSSSPYL